MSNPIVIIGGGLSGLTCATQLHAAGVEFTLLEASDGVGGRVRTDNVDGFLLDRGFQVLLTCLLYTSPSPRDQRGSRMPSSA